MEIATLASIIIMVLGAIICSFISNRLSIETPKKPRIFSAKNLNALSIICIMGVAGIMFWKHMNFYTVPRILLLMTVCSYIRNKKSKRLCLPFWKKLRITLKAYAILGGAGLAMEVINRATNGKYTYQHVAIIFGIVIPIVILLIIIINIIFSRFLTRRRVSSYYY